MNGLTERLNSIPEIFVQDKLFKTILMPTKVDPFFVENEHSGDVVFAHNGEDSLKEIFFEYSRNKLQKHVSSIANEFGFSYTRISVRNQRSRWASCSTSGTMSFNWRMIFLKPDLQRYIILHEFAHQKFMDHSVSFWIYLSRLCPNAKKLDRMLAKESQAIINLAR